MAPPPDQALRKENHNLGQLDNHTASEHANSTTAELLHGHAHMYLARTHVQRTMRTWRSHVHSTYKPDHKRVQGMCGALRA